MCGGYRQPRLPIVVRHSTTGKGRCATISNPTLDRLKLHSIVRYSIVWWMQAAQASYSGEAQHQKKGRCATIGDPTLQRLKGLLLTLWPVQPQKISIMHVGKGYEASAIRWGKGGEHPLPQGGAGQHSVCKRKRLQTVQGSCWTDIAQLAIALCGGYRQLKPPIVVRHNTRRK